MKILIDHGSSYNLGDTAMLEAVVLRLNQIFPQSELFVIDRPNLKTMIWDLPNVYKQSVYIVRIITANAIEKLPYFCRYSTFWRKLISNLILISLGNFMRAGSLVISSSTKNNAGVKNLKSFCDPFDALCIVGGGNLNDTFHSTLFHKSCLIHAFVEQKKPVILTGQQIGPFNSRLSMDGLFSALRKVNFLGLRDSGDSLFFCKKANLDTDRFKVMGDDSLGICASDKLDLSELLRNYNLTPKKFLAVNVRISTYTKEIPNYLKQIALLIDKLASQLKMPVLVVPISLNSTSSDITAGKELKKLMNYRQVNILEYQNATPLLTKGILSKAFGALGVSYHFCTFALSEGIPTVCLYEGEYYGQKAKSINLSWQDERLSLSLKYMNIDSALQQILEVLMDTSLKKRLIDRAKMVSDQWHSTFDNQIKNTLSNFIKT